MQIAKTITEVRHHRWQNPTTTWGLVPTMGFLHAGHLSLVRRAQAENEKTAVSIFVNPTQFAPGEDLASYPRDIERDLALLADLGTDLVFLPDNATIYPPDFQTEVVINQVTRPLEGASRPTHFRGVATVVAKLFNIIQPHRAYFGQKDAQQTIVVRQLIRDLNFNIDLVICPVVREPDGLAMSSRNKYLTTEQRQAAVVVNQALRAAETAYRQGERHGRILRQLMHDTITTTPLARVDYVSVADPHTLAELEEIGERVLLSTAVFFGSTRLIDNILIE